MEPHGRLRIVSRLLVAAVGTWCIAQATAQEFPAVAFNAPLDQTRRPQLVRMLPDALAPFLRRPADPRRPEDLDTLGNPITNVVVLVHGHCEAEGNGTFGGDGTALPWERWYKRDVWNLLYRMAPDTVNDPRSCTAVYEFVYPTYWPIFTPVQGREQDLLGASLADAIIQGAENDGRLLARLRVPRGVEAGTTTPFNLYFVAHSMGGVVVRAALPRLPEALLNNFQRLITWGTPHHGGPPVTLGYLLAQPYNLNVDGLRLPATDVLSSAAFQKMLRAAIADTPGWRDLRWDNGLTPPRGLRLSTLFEEQLGTVVSEPEWDRYNLETGTWLYNPNLRTFNQRDPFRLSARYVFMFGTTRRSLNDYPAALRDRPSENEVLLSAGATVIRRMMQNGDQPLPGYGNVLQGDSDGAVSVYSSAGVGIAPAYQARNLGDVDHEQYYGSPANGTYPRPASEEIGVRTADKTWQEIGLSQDRCLCPRVDVLRPFGPRLPQPGKELAIEAKLVYPESLGPQTGVRIEEARAVIQTLFTDREQVLGPLAVDRKTGRMTGAFVAPELPTGEHLVVVRVRLRDGAETEGAHLAERPLRFRLTRFKRERQQGEFASPQARDQHLPALEGVARAPHRFELELPPLDRVEAEKQIWLRDRENPGAMSYIVARSEKAGHTNNLESYRDALRDEGAKLDGRCTFTSGADPSETKLQAIDSMSIQLELSGREISGRLEYYGRHVDPTDPKKPRVGVVAYQLRGEAVE